MKKILFIILLFTSITYSQVERASRWIPTSETVINTTFQATAPNLVYDTTWTFRNGVIFDGTDDYFTVEDGIITSYPFTLEASFKTSRSKIMTIIQLSDKDVSNIEYKIKMASDGTVAVSARNTDNFETSTINSYNDGVWHCVVGVYLSATDRKLYIDGELQAVDTESVSYSSAVDRVSIGRSGDDSPGAQFVGEIAHPRIYNKALSATEVTDPFNQGLGVEELPYVLRDASQTEHLDETDFASHANWDVTGDFDDTGGNATFTWASNTTSTLTQVNADMALAAVGKKKYRLIYTCAVTTAPDGDFALTLTTGIASTAVTLDFTAGTFSYEFTTKDAPGDFVISAVSGTDTEGTFSIDDISLIQIGNVFDGVLNATVVKDLSANGNDGVSSGSPVDGKATPYFPKSIEVYESVDLTPQSTVAYQEGRIYYDSDDNTLVIYNDEADVSMNVGEEMWKHVRNQNTGGTIPDGTPVYITGASGQIATIDSTDADVAATSLFAGLTTHDIENNTNGYITVFGIVRGLDTDGSPYGESWSDGDMIYLSQTKGWLTNIRPSAAYVVQVGNVDYAHNSLGRIQVHPKFDWAEDFRAGDLYVSGANFRGKTNVADANYGTSALTNDHIIAFTSISAARTVIISTEDRDSGTATLPRMFIIIDQSGDCSGANTITISLETSGNINGGANFILTGAYESISIYVDGTNAFIY